MRLSGGGGCVQEARGEEDGFVRELGEMWVMLRGGREEGVGGLKIVDLVTLCCWKLKLD